MNSLVFAFLISSLALFASVADMATIAIKSSSLPHLAGSLGLASIWCITIYFLGERVKTEQGKGG